MTELEELLNDGHHVVVDRYAFSGVAFSACKDNMSMEWCKQPDIGLPKPDVVCFLDVSPDEAMKRNGFGKEHYEQKEFQIKARKIYSQLMDNNWKVIHTDKKTLDQVYSEVYDIIQSLLDNHDNLKPIEKLWV